MQLEKDCRSLIGHSDIDEGINRRNFIQTAVGVGFAAATLPVFAQSVIKTDATGLTAGVISLDIHGQKVPLYYAQPEGKSNLPVILVVSEIFGVHEHISDVARRFAKQGYLALAPELFIRQGDAGKYSSIAELIKEVISKVPDAQVMSDLDAVVAWAGQHGGDITRLGITGFCWGGRITWMYAAHNPSVKAGVAWYGRLIDQPNALSPTNPIDIAPTLTVPILGLYGAKDTGISVESVQKMQSALAKGNSHSEFRIYENSGHAFHADYRPSYVEADAKDGWARCLAWFKAHQVI
ncbi:dienelactone hydrolase family protein [Undibacterium oligocarboniphilum]|uniref:Dienelactone hydrolase family protein n=1 Tax=Undibacterium oligocarboniphilum TaxID=666702 RepID=A0A850QPD7_9BURK|nr:dienelactone hydrolase family protein [Undibacterium oligocarboniphilum]MBC3870619.1 dienelactone hydrolase family protein [Undibacterium oligocarboniphilum]NVO78580.1 dienelactone hydrolase family protein [Undibacterium oligocarboniphilum]